MVKNKHIPLIVLVIGRGDAIRNFLYTDTLRLLSKNAKVTLITSIMDEKILNRFDQYISEKIKLVFYQENKYELSFLKKSQKIPKNTIFSRFSSWLDRYI